MIKLELEKCAAGRWQPVDKKPEKEGLYLAFGIKGWCFIRWSKEYGFLGNHGLNEHELGITHWASLSSPEDMK